jgi:signal transduction histidine kinase
MRYSGDLTEPAGIGFALFEDRSGRLMLGLNSGLTSLQGERFVPDEDLAEVVYAIEQDATGAMWFATPHGLVRRTSPGRLTRYRAEDGLPHTRATALMIARSGALWVGTMQGIARFEGERVAATYSEAEGLAGNWVRAFYEDNDGILWIGTYDGGLYRLKDDTLTRYTTREGLHDNGVFQILEDDFGFFWMGSNRGLSRVSRRELNDFAEGRTSSVRSRVFGIRDGMTSLECNGGRQPAGLKTADGRLWIPTMGGVAIVDPSRVEDPSGPPPVIIEEALVEDQPVALGGEITIPHDATTFEIRYTAPSFLNPERLRFRHRMLGLDERWIESRSQRAATYHRLPPGRYRFVVSAAHEDGDWSPDSAPVVLVVRAPYWQQTWFLGLALLTFAVTGLAMDRRRVARHRREQARQAAFTRHLIETQEAERKRIAGELHDSLGQDLYVIRAHARSARAGHASPGGFDAALDAIDDVARKASDELKEVTLVLRPYHLDRIGLSAAIRNMVRSVSDASGISITADVDGIDDVLDPDRQVHAFRIVQESVSNIVRHSGAASARVAARRAGPAVEITIEDDGRGFHPEAIDASGAAGGLGLMAIRERARGLGGEAEVRSTRGRGTVVVARIPIGGASHGG